ncbi:hypothetical protein [Sphingomonas sp. RS2018]
MTKFKAAVAVVISFILLPSVASAQLTSRERIRAEEVARIQAKADAEERAKERRARLDSAQSECRSTSRQWDYANQICKPRGSGITR